jgi:hypothetical protein
VDVVNLLFKVVDKVICGGLRREEKVEKTFQGLEAEPLTFRVILKSGFSS